MLGLTIGLKPWMPAADVTNANGTLVASGALAEALDTQLASNQSADGAVRIGLSFRDKDGRTCRSFEARSLSGIGCREDGRWSLERTMGGAAQGEYRQAASGALATDVAAMMTGEPFRCRSGTRARVSDDGPSDPLRSRTVAATAKRHFGLGSWTPIAVPLILGNGERGPVQLSRREFSLALATSLVAAPAVHAAEKAGANDAAFTTFLDAAFEAEIALDPEQLTQLGRKEQQDRFTDPSDAAAAARLEWRRGSVAAMKRQFDRATLGEDARVSYDMWVLELERAEASTKWRGHNYIFDRNGPHTGLPNFLINQHRVDTPVDMEAYVARVAALGPTLDLYLDRAKASAAKGIRMPGFAYDQSIELIGRLTSGAPFGNGADNALYVDAREKAAGLVTAGKIDAAAADRYTAQVAAAMTGSMKPAYDRLGAWLAADRAKASAEPRGAGALPDGAAYYNAMLRLQTTTGMTAEEIHESRPVRSRAYPRRDGGAQGDDRLRGQARGFLRLPAQRRPFLCRERR